MSSRTALATLAPPLFAAVLAAPPPIHAAEDGPVVVVTATRQAQRINELISDVTVIEREAIEAMGSGTVIDLLSRQPGMQMMQNGGPGTAADVFMRGSRTDQTKIIVDGVPINSIDLKGSPLRLIPLDQVERVEIVRGPASTLYGADAVGGVIQVFTRRPTEGAGGDAFVGLGTNRSQRLSGSVYGGDDRLRVGLAVNDVHVRSLSAVRDATRVDADMDSHRNTGFNGFMTLTAAPGQEIAVAWMRNRGQTTYDSTTGTGAFDSRVDFFNETWSVNGRSRVNDDWTTSLRYGQSTDDQTNFTSLTPSVLISEGRQLGWQNDVKLPLGTALILIERQEQKVAPASRFPRNTTTSDDAVALGWNGNRDGHRWQWSNRQSRNSSFGNNSTWTGGYGYQIDPAWRAGFVAGKSFRAPTPYQLYIATFGNSALQPETGRSTELNLTWSRNGWSAGAVRYRNRVDNLIDFVATSNRYENISRAMLQGWTFTVNGHLGGWNLGASLDLLDAKNIATGKSLERRAARKLTVSLDRIWGSWTTGIETVFVGPRYNSTTDTQTMGGYTLINLVARHALSSSLSLELRGDNITNKHYATALTTNGNKEYSTPGASLFAGLRYTFR